MIAKLRAMLRMRCPRCTTGPMFSGPFTMNRRCAECGLDFEPEPGYYIGALYVNYFLGMGLISPMVAYMIWFNYSAYAIGGASVVALALLAPVVFRYARVMWFYLDMLFFDTKRCMPSK